MDVSRLGVLCILLGKFVTDLLQQQDRLLFGRNFRLFGSFLLGFAPFFRKLGFSEQGLGHVTEFVDRHENAEIHGRRDNQKIQYRAKYCAERNRRIIECDCQQTIHIRFAENHGDERINHIVDDRINHCGDGTAHDNTDRHVDHVAACNELLESFNHDDSPIM